MDSKTIPWWYTALGSQERHSLEEAFQERRFTLGSGTRELESRLAGVFGVRHAVVTNSGSSALAMSLLALGIGPGDEVIVPGVTWIATAQAAALLGAKVVVADTLADTPIIDPVQVLAKCSSKTKLIIPVHLNGRYCDLPALRKIADQVGAEILEDTCKGMMSSTPEGYLGTLSRAGCFSMGMISLLSIGYGGFVLTNDNRLWERLQIIRDHGVVRQPKEEYKYLGYNFKVSDLLTSLALPQVRELKAKAAYVIQVHRRYRQGLAGVPGVEVLPVDVDSNKVPLYTELRSPAREDLAQWLEQNGVQISRYHLAVSQAPYLHNTARLTNAERLTSECFIVPSGPSQPMEHIEKVIGLIVAWAEKRETRPR